MTAKPQKDLEFILNHPKTAHAISDVNTETIRRRSFSPKQIATFAQKYSECRPRPEYRFSRHSEAERLLCGIIDQPVVEIVTAENRTAEGNPVFSVKRHIGIVFSGGPAPGGHNVISGVFDEARKYNPESKIFGFLNGPDGLIEEKYIEITPSLVDAFRNMGGFSMIRTGRTKIDNQVKIDRALATCKKLNLDALVIIGGDDSNTNAAFLAQAFKSSGIKVIGVPKTIDGDIQVKSENSEPLCAVSFGFHSAAVAFSENIGRLCTDASSDVKYWHICKVMGRVASHLTLECAFQTHANLSLIGEELADYIDQERIDRAMKSGRTDYTAYGMTLRHLSRLICDTIVKRAASGKNFGVIILPEGILEFINEIQTFIIKLNKIIADFNRVHDMDFHQSFPSLSQKLDYLKKLSRGLADVSARPIWNQRDDDLFDQLPPFFQEGLLVERDTHGNFQFSQVRTEQIILDMVKEYLAVLKEQGKYKVGIPKVDYIAAMQAAKLAPETYAAVLFRDPDADFLLIKEHIISKKTLVQTLVDAGLIDETGQLPKTVLEIFEKSVPKFKTQTHFYGYDGRGADPTPFDCNYAYNLGLTAFHLIVGGLTGMMAAIKNLEKPFEQWQAMGIPIARLMHLEERKGKLELVMEKSLVDLDSNAFRVFKAMRKQWLGAGNGNDHYRRPGATLFSKESEADRPIILTLNAV